METFKKHISVLYLLCPTVPPRVLSNDQWWEVVKEVGGLCHTIPLLDEKYREEDSLSQIEYLIVQFIQSDPPLLAIRWLMGLYSLINRYIKLSVSKLSKELVYLIHQFTGIEIEDSINIERILNKSNVRNNNPISSNYSVINTNNKYEIASVNDKSSNPHINTDYLSSNSVLDLAELISRDIQPNFIITSLYVLQTLLRLEIIETRKDISNLYKSVPQLMLHVDKRVRDASSEFLLTMVHLGVPGYSLSDNLIHTFFKGVKVLMELDDFINVQRLIQSMIVIFKQYSKLVSLKRHEILQLIVNISSSLVGENNSTMYLKNEMSNIIELLSHLLANTVFVELGISNREDGIFEGFEYITSICNIKFSTYGLGSYPVQGECFRIIISYSILILFELYENNHWNEENKLTNYIDYIERIRDLILSHFQSNYIRKHITESFQWLSNNHWVFLWSKVIEKIIFSFILYIQKNSNDKNNTWLLFKNFISPFIKISPGITIECIFNIINSTNDINFVWKIDSELQELMIDWIFRASFTESFEMYNSSYYSGGIVARLIQYNNYNTQEIKLNSIFDNLLTFNKIDFLSLPIDDDYSQALIHNSHFLIGLSNYTSSSSLLTIMLEHIINYLTKFSDLNLFFNQKIFNDKLFILNNSFLVINNVLSNLMSVLKNTNIQNEMNKYDHLLNNLCRIMNELNRIIIPICKIIISNNNVENISTILESLIESSERLKLIKNDNESSALSLFEDDKDNPIMLLFKDFKQWIFILWNSLGSIRLFLLLNDFLLNNNSTIMNKQISADLECTTNNALKLKKYLVKACFNVLNNLLPNIPRNWISILPGDKLLNNANCERNIQSLVKSVLMNIELNKYNFNTNSTTSIDDLENILLSDQSNIINEEYSNISAKLLSNTSNDDNNYDIVETLERFVFPFIGDSCCSSRYVHFSVLLMLLKQTVYKELNDNLFKYNNHPKFSIDSMNMIILDLVSDPLVSFLDPKYPDEVFPFSECEENKVEKKCVLEAIKEEVDNNVIVNKNDILSLLDYNIDVKNSNLNDNLLITTKFGLLESMKVITIYPCIINQSKIKLKRNDEIIFRMETSKLFSNILFESIINNDNFQKITKLLLKLLYLKTIDSMNYWSYIIPEYNYSQKENNKINIVNLFQSCSDLSPTLYITSIQNIINTPNDSSTMPILSILFFTKYLINHLIDKIEELLLNSNNNDNVITINNCYNTLVYIVSSVFKYLFGVKNINYDKNDSLNSIKPKQLPPRIKSSIIRYYLINLLVNLLNYFYFRKDMFNYYNTFVNKLDNIIYYINYLNKNNIKTSDDNDLILDLNLFFLITKLKKVNIDDKLFKKTESLFINDSLNIFDNSKSLLFELKKILVCNNIIDDIISLHFEMDIKMEESNSNITDRNIEITESNKYMDCIGEYLCFYNYEELHSTGIFNSIIEYINAVIKNMSIAKIDSVDSNLINKLMAISFSLIYQTRIHETPLIDYNKYISIPLEFKYSFKNKEFLPNLCNLLLRVNRNLFEKSRVDNINNFKLKHLDAPLLNLLLVLLINDCFINNSLDILSSFSVENFKSLIIQENKFSIMLSKWLIDNNISYLSIKFLNNYFLSLSISELINFSFNIIIYDINKGNNNHCDYSNLDKINEISKYLLDGNKNLSYSAFPLYIQLNPYFYYFNLFSSKNGFKFNNNYVGFIYSNNFVLITQILKAVFEMIYNKLDNRKCENELTLCVSNNHLKFNIVKDYIYKSKYLSLLNPNKKNNTFKSNLNINDKPINNDNLEKIFIFLCNFTSFLIITNEGIDGINNYYINEFILNEYTYIIKLILKIMKHNDNNYFTKVNCSEFVNNIFNLLTSIEPKINSDNFSYKLFINLIDILICLYNYLNIEKRLILWDIVVNVAYNDNTNISFDSSEIVLLYNLISRTDISILNDVNNENDFTSEITLSENSKEKLMSIYFNISNNLIPKEEYNNEKGLILFSHFSYFLVDKVHNFELIIKSIDFFRSDNIDRIISSILKQNNIIIYCVPSIILIWNKVNKTSRYNKIIIDILVLLYSGSTKYNDFTLNALFILLEVISSIDSLLSTNFINDSGLNNTFEFNKLNKQTNNNSENLKFMIIKYYKQIDNYNNTYKCDCLFIFIIYYFFLYISELCFDTISFHEIEVYTRLYKLIFDYYLTFIEKYNIYIKLDYIINTNKYLLELFKRVVLFSNDNSSMNFINPTSNEIKETLVALIIYNSEYIIDNSIRGNKDISISILLDSHLNWIENEIINLIVEIGNKLDPPKYIDMLIDIVFRIMAFMYNSDINYTNEEYKRDKKSVVNKCFMIFRYLLCSSLYVHPEYFTILRNYLNNSSDIELEMNIIPDFVLFKEYHESLLNIILSKIEQYLNEINSEYYYLDLFNFLKITTLPFGFIYSMENEFTNKKDKNTEYNDYVFLYPNKKCWNIINSLKSTNDGNGNSCMLEEYINNYKKSYLNIIENTEYKNLFQFKGIIDCIYGANNLNNHIDIPILIPSAITL
ncbi:hypothetical protein FG379_003169, partial [Cryptosporidium bovis]|uniref:uncharacterized protein n=1 Tax=Cryptosporidium bovis TaxID=310047 RepID=UPI00351A17E4